MDKDTAAFIETLQQRLIDAWPKYRERTGQQSMMTEIDQAFSAGQLEKSARAGRHIAVIEGRTGVGKTIGYLIPALAHALTHDMNLVISTATVALQEQLVRDDLPRLAKLSPIPFEFGIIKGRGRYVCMENVARALNGAAQVDAFDQPVETDTKGQALSFYKNIQQVIDQGQWNGEKDTLPIDLDERLWKNIQVDSHTCTGKHCPQIRTCLYAKARRQTKNIKILVANHDLVLACLKEHSPIIPAPEKTLFVFDEAHHLPEVALSHFSGSFGVFGLLRVLDKLRPVWMKAELAVPQSEDSPKNVLPEVQMLHELLQRFGTELGALSWVKDKPIRFEHGVVPESMLQAIESLQAPLKVIQENGQKLELSLNAYRESAPEAREQINRLLVDLSPLLSKLSEAVTVTEQWQAEHKRPFAKWIVAMKYGRQVDYVLHSSPLQGDGLLHRYLWQHVRAAALVSATITAGGTFNFFAGASGLRYTKGVRYLAVDSPFRYSEQAELIVPAMRFDPKAPADHAEELTKLIAEPVATLPAGGLMLFASKRQMESTYQHLPPELQAKILMQGIQAKQAILKQHREKVARGEPSLIFGLQSFGEGVDLPADLCQLLMIDKIPFAPPDNPVDEALAEWLERQHRDPFMEIVVPRAAIKLNQWTGRLLRSETDFGRVIIFDTRLMKKRYGKILLDGLPPFRRSLGVTDLTLKTHQYA